MAKVYVGLSGGVDSAVAAALLKEAGHEVIGGFIKIWQSEFLECSWREDRLDAMRVAAYLGIPYREIDLSEEYEASVVRDMLARYRSGITPNPDVLCNKTIKFGAFADWAFREGAEYIATGHHARAIHTEKRSSLLRGKDAAKDQSYFLYAMPQDALRRTFLPVGEFQKSEVRALALSYGLPVAQRPDSQGLCFVGDVSMADFLSRFLPLMRGRVLDTAGEEVGMHEGAALYTIGQRHGFTLERSSEPHFVVSIDAEANTITVSPKREDAARMSTAIVDAAWLQEPESGCVYDVATRYRESPQKAKLEKIGDEWGAHFERPHVISPGQSLVVYQGERVLGGGRIAS